MSPCLVDTHVWLWMQSAPDRVRPNVRDLVVTYVPDRLRRSGTTALPVEVAHALRTSELPDHHRDPFDRLLIAQAQLLNIPIVSSDAQLSRYDVAVVAA